MDDLFSIYTNQNEAVKFINNYLNEQHHKFTNEETLNKFHSN